MKKKYILLIFLFTAFIGQAQIINFPDPSFKARLVTSSVNNGVVTDFSGNYFHLDVNNDGQIQVSEALLVKEMNIGGQDGTNMYYNMGGIEYFTNMVSLRCSSNPITSLDVSGLPQLKELNCWGTELTSLDLTNLINLEVLKYGANPQLTNLTVSSANIIKELSCDGNNLTTLNLSLYPHLKSLDCSYNQLTSLDLSSFPNFESLDCSFNQFSSLNITGLTNLKHIDCSNNLQLPLIDFSQYSNLESINCGYNPLQSSVNVTDLSSLEYLFCSNLNLSSLDLSTNLQLTWLECSNNQLTSLELNDHINMHYLNCSNNLLDTLFIKGLTMVFLGMDDVSFENNPNLSYICANESMLDYIQYKINSYNYANCSVNNYCSFTPGGTYYTIQGSNKYDENNDGCSPSDINYPFLKLSIFDGTNTGNLISNYSGSYTLPIVAGTHIITPVLETPLYFNIFPSTATVVFPTAASPFEQNFCISPNGTHNDLEVTILPLSVCQAGFDVKYKVVCRNRGTNVQSALVNFNFNDAILDYVSSIPMVSTQDMNVFTWNLTDIAPFETREIELILNLNSPIETPPVNEGDVLNFTVSISGLTDETPGDNVFTLNQTVVNSFDPNDKTCLEGAAITPDMIGKYLHYIIRFENTGTAAAQNIVVKDVIDTTKFDINSLVSLTGSHSFATRISDSNKVEFLFENIQLPFDDANNDGYLSFKIKTLPSLVEGNAIENTASIYFDYNMPIVTNTAVTTIQDFLSTSEFSESNFIVYPNPANEVIYVTNSDLTHKITSVVIYNILGQQVVMVTSSDNIGTVDVSSLASGNYLMKIKTQAGTSIAKFLKK